MEIRVNSNDERIDKYLKRFLNCSRENIVNMIKKGDILVNGSLVKPSYLVKIGDNIKVDDKNINKEEIIEPKEIKFDIVYEDDDLMVINKPSGLVVHPGSGNKDNTLVNGLLYYTNTLGGVDSLRPGIVHRLDKDTSGLMLVAKSNKAYDALIDDFKNKRIYREYVSLITGVFPHTKAVIDAPIGRDKDIFSKRTVSKDGKKAITNLEVIKRYKEYTLVKLVLETGRTHQIRVHMAYIGYPVFNDPLYSKKKCSEFGQFLHSKYLKFKHPVTGKVLEFDCDVPKYFKDFLDNLE